jgi:signal transduction histidine kinase
MRHQVERCRPPLLDALLALGFLVAAEVELAHHQGLEGPRWVGSAAVAVLMSSLAWRTSLPLVVAAISVLSITVLALPGDLQTLNLPMVALFVPPYSVARNEPRRRAGLGLVICLGVPLAAALPTPAAGGLAFSVGMVVASWTAGRATRSNSLRAQALRRQTARTVAAREEVQRLVLVAERSRIARELQGVVVASVSEMVLGAETARRLLTKAPEEADQVMASVDVTARQVLSDVRRVLGILRAEGQPVDLCPLPGIAHLDALRGSDGRRARLQVEGAVRPVSASVDLGVFRIAESAMECICGHPLTAPLDVGLRYTPASVDIELSVGGRRCVGWPTPFMQEWADLCEARVSEDTRDSRDHLVVSIPDSSSEAIS